ncbi:MAG: glycosyl hydrolase family 18 protein [Ginsengibacter sp.]
MIKQTALFFFFLYLLNSEIGNAQFRVVGYVPVSRYYKPDLSKIQFDKLTHINIAFVNPDSSGGLHLYVPIDSLVTMAHSSRLKVLASLGGGNSPVSLPRLLMAENRDRFTDSIVNFIIANDLDGEDVDIEGDAVDSNYKTFVKELAEKLHHRKKLITAAIATYFSEKISNETLSLFDFINVMSYDYTGPWTPKEPGQHSSYAKAVEDLNYFIIKRGINKKKIVLGVPFYGYQFGKYSISGFSFSSILDKYPGSELEDMIVINDSTRGYYNGIPTIRKKVSLALEKAGGIMIWQLYQDGEGKNSLLNNINTVIQNQRKPLKRISKN